MTCPTGGWRRGRRCAAPGAAATGPRCQSLRRPSLECPALQHLSLQNPNPCWWPRPSSQSISPNLPLPNYRSRKQSYPGRGYQVCTQAGPGWPRPGCSVSPSSWRWRRPPWRGAPISCTLGRTANGYSPCWAYRRAADRPAQPLLRRCGLGDLGPLSHRGIPVGELRATIPPGVGGEAQVQVAERARDRNCADVEMVGQR